MNKESSIYQENRPWGLFRQFTKNSLSTVKILKVNPGEILSLQSHTKRSEFWRSVSGSGVATIGEEEVSLTAGNEVFIPCGAKHRLEAGSDGLEVLEISFGDFDEDDITRYDDRYGRP